MAHTTEIVEVKHVADELLSVLVRCCGDEKTDSWHTMHADVYVDDSKLQASLEHAHNRVRQTHAAHLAAIEKLDSLKGQKVEHS